MSVQIKKDDCEITNKNPPIEFPYQLDIFQKNAINSIEEDNHILVTAHTSAGKSTVAEYAIAKAQYENEKIVYTSPIKTLSNQKYYDFKNRFNSVGIFTGDIKENPDASCMVMTTECLRNTLFRGDCPFKYCIFDEVHYINDRDRGHVWEETIVMLPKNVIIIALSATIDNALKFASWIAKIKNKNVDIVSTYKRPVPLRHYVFCDNDLHQIMDNSRNFDGGKYQDLKQKYSKMYRQRINYQTHINNLVTYLKEKDLFPCIFFSFSRKKCEDFAKKVTINLITKEERSAITTIFDKYMTGIFKNYQKLEQTLILKKLLYKGIGFHHSGLVHPLKEIQEILFSKGLIKLLFATETFSVGVNMPTRTVVFTDLQKFDGSINGFRNLKTAEYIQMAGRGGRRGKDKFGVIIHLYLREPPSHHEMLSIMTGGSAIINSRLKLNTQFLMKTLKSKDFTLSDFCNSSLLGDENDDSNSKLKNEFESLSKRIASKKVEVDNIVNKDEVNRYFQLQKEIETSKKSNKKKRLRTQANYILESKQTKKEIDVKIKYNELIKKASDIEYRIGVNNIHTQLNVSKDFLIELGFLNKSNKLLLELNREDLSKKGLMGAEINECNEILLVEIIERQLFKELSVKEIYGILAIFIEDKNEFNLGISDLKISDKMKDILYEIGGLNVAIDKVACSYSLDYNPYICLNFVEAAYKWASQETAADIYKQCSLELYAGNFVKNLTKILNICNEIIHVCELIGNTELVEKLENIESLILRDIVSFDSIYLTNLKL